MINLDRAEKLEKMTYSSLFSKAGIIVLEDTDESLLGKVDKLEVCDNNLYVLEKGRGLFLFNEQGKFIKMIGRQHRSGRASLPTATAQHSFPQLHNPRSR